MYIYIYVHESFEHAAPRTRGIKLQMLTSMTASRQRHTGRERNDTTWWPKAGAAHGSLAFLLTASQNEPADGGA